MLSRRFATKASFASTSVSSTAKRALSTKVSAVDSSDSKISSLTFKINAGSRYSTKDGISHLLSRFNFLSTKARSALRLQREAELLGGSFKSSVSRDYITLNANFLKEDLPFFVNAFSDVLTAPSFKDYNLPEIVLPAAQYDLSVASACPFFKSIEESFAISFRNDLGKPLYYDGVAPISLEEIEEFSKKVYTQNNIEISGQGINEADLTKFVTHSSFSSLPEGSSLLASAAPKTFVGVESRIRSTGSSVLTLSIPVLSKDFATYQVLSTYLSSSLFASSESISNVSFDKFNNAGLFTLSVAGSNAASISSAFKSIVKTLKSGVELSSAVPLTKTSLALASESLDVAAVKNFKLGKFNYVAVGNVSELPFADEL